MLNDLIVDNKPSSKDCIISIIIPAQNSRKTIRKTLKSTLNKRFPNGVTIPRSGFALTRAPAGILHGYDVGNQPQICQDLTVLHSESH